MGALSIERWDDYTQDYIDIVIPTDPASREDGFLEHAYFIGSEGALGLAETDSQPVDRTYSDGVVFPPNLRRTAKDYTVDILLTDLSDPTVTTDDLQIAYSQIEYLVAEKTVWVTTDTWSLTSQCQRIEFITNELHRNKKVAVIRLYFKGE